jgi:hypothetical protein
VSKASLRASDDCIDFLLDDCADIGLVSEQELGVHPRPANIGASIVAQTQVGVFDAIGVRDD